MRMVKVALPLSLLIAMSAALGGCSQLQEAVGQTKKAPDEFQVVSRAPLSLPPNFDLKPPQPGAVRPQEGTTSEQAAERILGRKIRSSAQQVTSSTSQSASASNTSFEQKLGLGQAKPDIRKIVDSETETFVYETKYPIDYLLFWVEGAEKGIVLDPKKEQKRLRENSALGRPADTGQTPTIERKNRSVLEKLF